MAMLARHLPLLCASLASTGILVVTGFVLFLVGGLQ